MSILKVILIVTAAILCAGALIATIVYCVLRSARKNRANESPKRNIPDERKENPAANLAGKEGEQAVQWCIGKTVVGKQYVFNNYTFFAGVYSNEIDHIVVNKHGVFVLETKTLGGTVTGTEEDEFWQHDKTNGQTEMLTNPIKQNATHAEIVGKLLDGAPIIPLVVFVKNNCPQINSDKIVPLSDLSRKLNYGNDLLDSAQMAQFAKILEENDAHLTTEQHLANIRRVNDCLKNGICPACGGKLVLRQGKTDDYYGCSNYPKCTFTRKNLD